MEMALAERPVELSVEQNRPTGVLEAIKPFSPDDGHKGTFLVMRIAGLEQGTALKLVNRKYRTYLEWKATDPYFKVIDEQVPELIPRFGGEARVIRTALLDISIIETGISIFRKILHKETITEGMWSYAVKMAGIRVPMMGANQEVGNPWERLANSIKQTLTQRDMVITRELDGSETVRARELTIKPDPEQQRVANQIIQRILAQNSESN